MNIRERVNEIMNTFPTNLTILKQYHSTKYLHRSAILVQGEFNDINQHVFQLVQSAGLKIKLIKNFDNAVSIPPLYVHSLSTTTTSSSTLSWGLDRIDQRQLPLNGIYQPVPPGANSSVVNVYLVDTGVYVGNELQGIVSLDYSYDPNNYVDCYGHGTHVAGIIASKNWGVMQGNYVKIHSVKVLDCNGYGSLYDLLAGLLWVEANLVPPAVINLSLEYGSYDSSIASVISSLETVAFVSVAGGNSGSNACNAYPGSEKGVAEVGASDAADYRAGYSNYGSCLSLFAPGSNITSLWLNNQLAILSGTSMATGFVSGAGALYLRDHRTKGTTTVLKGLLNSATKSVISNVGINSPNMLLYVGDWNISPPSSPSSSISNSNPSSSSSITTHFLMKIMILIVTLNYLILY